MRFNAPAVIRPLRLVTPQRSTNGLEQKLVAERLGQECDRASLHCPLTRIRVVVGRDEDNWDSMAPISQMALELESIHHRHLHVGHEARRLMHPTRFQETLRRFERGSSKAERLDQPDCGPSHGRIIVDYRDDIHRSLSS
jgi:hypothetical protein